MCSALRSTRCKAEARILPTVRLDLTVTKKVKYLLMVQLPRLDGHVIPASPPFAASLLLWH